MSGTLKLAVSGGGRHVIKNVMPKDRVEEIAAYVRGRIAPGQALGVSADATTPLPAGGDAATGADDHAAIVERLKKLKELNEQGVITDDEYAEKRASLLERL